VPVHVEGEAASETLVVVEHSTVTIEAEATHIPQSIVISVQDLEPGTQILAADLSLPEGSTLVLDPEILIVNVTAAQSAEAAAAELAEAEAEAGMEPRMVEEAGGEAPETGAPPDTSTTEGA
jgi:large subunit ribosomal protein L25